MFLINWHPGLVTERDNRVAPDVMAPPDTALTEEQLLVLRTILRPETVMTQPPNRAKN